MRRAFLRAILPTLGLIACGKRESVPLPAPTQSAAQPASSLSAIGSSAAGPAESSPKSPSAAVVDSSCAEQAAQDFLVRAHLNSGSMKSVQAQLSWLSDLQRSIRYRTEQYGYYEGYGLHAWNLRRLDSQMRSVKFFGRSVQMHERVIPALRCVETAIEHDCADQPYRPRLLAGFRTNNTYFGGDVSNHVYGIAIDIDPNDNPCCNCVKPWRDNPRCRGKKTDLERMTMPACWITAFERFGFYWLGHDELKDTMHFEFLGDPARIIASPSPP